MTACHGQANPSHPFPRWVAARVARLLVMDSGCWVWTGPVSDSGYGLARRGVHTVRVHRWVWVMSGRPLLVDHDLDHQCRRRPCANPEHLIPTDHAVHGALSRAWQLEREAGRR